MLDVHQFMCRQDNFGILLRDPVSGVTALVDAPEEGPILRAIEETGWQAPSLLLITHHHGDHVEANLALKQRFGLSIIGPAKEAEKIPGIDRAMREGDIVHVGKAEASVVETPGHTAGHISYYFRDAGIAFTADTLFALGCGRVFECSPAVMYQSLKKLAALPPETIIYCGHEYTAANARFALTIDPTNQSLQERAKKIEALRSEGKPTLPTTIAEELATNPFLRWSDPAIRQNLDMRDAPDDAVFAEIRRRKDVF